MTPILLRAFPVNAAAYSVYEGIMRLIGAEKVNRRRSRTRYFPDPEFQTRH